MWVGVPRCGAMGGGRKLVGVAGIVPRGGRSFCVEVKMLQHLAVAEQLAQDGHLGRERTGVLEVLQRQQTSGGGWLMMMEVGTPGQVRPVSEAAGHG